jgi:hypothetical protein
MRLEKSVESSPHFVLLMPDLCQIQSELNRGAQYYSENTIHRQLPEQSHCPAHIRAPGAVAWKNRFRFISSAFTSWNWTKSSCMWINGSAALDTRVCVLALPSCDTLPTVSRPVPPGVRTSLRTHDHFFFHFLGKYFDISGFSIWRVLFDQKVGL